MSDITLSTCLPIPQNNGRVRPVSKNLSCPFAHVFLHLGRAGLIRGWYWRENCIPLLLKLQGPTNPTCSNVDVGPNGEIITGISDAMETT